MHVMVLDRGQVVFAGSPEEFQTSKSSAVLRLTRPESGRRTTNEFIADPWSKKRRPKDKLF
jgi:hypothetical protein